MLAANYHCDLEHVNVPGLLSRGRASFWHHFSTIIFGKSTLVMAVWSSGVCVWVPAVLSYPGHLKGWGEIILL